VSFTGLELRTAGEPAVGGSGTTVSGIVSTRRGNAPGWQLMIGRPPLGDWTLDLNGSLTDGRAIRTALADDTIEDIFFVITYRATTPAWPV
jgi:hypothetical protein